MLTAKTQYNLTNAREYFEEHLCVGDYYDEGQRVSGQWIGAGAEQLGLSGKVRADDFLRLCENQHPKTGEILTQRLNTVRMNDGKEAVNRRVFYDFTFSPPKSVSVVALAGADERIVAAHDQAVWSAMRELETFAATRVRAGGGHGDRSTGNVAAALFTHDTSRALDPHLHTHCVIFNATFDPVEQRWKALQNYGMLQARKFAENVYSLLIKSCAMEARTIESQVQHLVRQLESPQVFCERILVVDSRRENFLRQFSDAEPDLMRQVCQRLLDSGWIDRVLQVPDQPDSITSLNHRWFGIESSSTHTPGEAHVAPIIFGFEACKGDYVLHVDSDASCQPDSRAERLTRKLGELLIDAGYRIVTGGMGGVMEAACIGAKTSKNYREGDTIGLLPGHSPESANPFVDIVIPTGLDFGRNYIVAHADAVVAIGGGAGTLSEICYAWMHKRLIVALGKEGWAGKLAGKKLDWRIRYQDIKDDKIFAAGNPRAAVKILGDWLPLYNDSYAAREASKRTSAKPAGSHFS